MPEYKPSISERWKKICEEMSAGSVTAGDGGFTASADPLGPVAGYDPVMNPLLKRTLKKIKKRINLTKYSCSN